MAYSLTRAATEDIKQIYLHGLGQFGALQADRYLDLLEKTFEFLADHPKAARIRAELKSDIRFHPLRSHVVMYRINDGGEILIIRVRHGHEDWVDPIFEDD